MGGNRDDFLRRVREAVQKGNRAGGTPPLPKRGTVGYQGAGDDPVARFAEMLKAAGGVFHPAADEAAAAETVLTLLRHHGCRRVLLGRGGVIDRLDLAPRLRQAGLEVTVSDAPPAGADRETLFAADVGVTGVEWLLAETGSVVVASRPDEPRSLSLLPPLHVAVADRSQLLPDLFDLFAATADRVPDDLPSNLTVITGPSKTGDIELKLVTGVHGPGEVHVLLLGAPEGRIVPVVADVRRKQAGWGGGT